MDEASGSLSAADLSDCLGAIYDCATDPSAWPRAIEMIAGRVDGVNGVIIAIDPLGRSAHFHSSWNVDAESMRTFNENYAADNPLIAPFNRYPIDEPYNVTAVLPAADWEASRIFREFARPRGYCDSLGVTLVKTPGYLASLSIVTSVDAGYAGPRELAIMRLIAPHARRALAISDMVNMQTLKSEGLEQALDALAPGILLLAADGALVHANETGRAMLDRRSPLALRRTQLDVRAGTGGPALARVLAGLAAGEPAGAATFGLIADDGAPVFAHLLPLASAGMNGSLSPMASYALFVTDRTRMPLLGRDAWAGAFGLTGAEARTLEHLVLGRSVTEIAADTGAALPTIRSHLARLFEKTGTSRQAELIRLAASLQPPLRGNGQT